MEGGEGQFSLLESGPVFGLAPFPGEAAAVPLGGFFPSAAHWKAVWKCGKASGSIGAGLQVCTGRCIVWTSLSPLLHPLMPTWAHRFSLLSVVTGHINRRVLEDSNAVDAGGKWRGGHVKLPLRLAATCVMSQGCFRDSLLECATPPEVSGYFQFVAECLHFAILTAQPCPEVASCFQFVMLLCIEPSTLALKKKIKINITLHFI